MIETRRGKDQDGNDIDYPVFITTEEEAEQQYRDAVADFRKECILAGMTLGEIDGYLERLGLAERKEWLN